MTLAGDVTCQIVDRHVNWTEGCPIRGFAHVRKVSALQPDDNATRAHVPPGAQATADR